MDHDAARDDAARQIIRQHILDECPEMAELVDFQGPSWQDDHLAQKRSWELEIEARRERWRPAVEEAMRLVAQLEES